MVPLIEWIHTIICCLTQYTRKDVVTERKEIKYILPLITLVFGPSHTHWPLFVLCLPTELLVSF